MKSIIAPVFPHPLALGAAVLLVVGGSFAQAQQVYRIVGPDGKVTFSDKPPVSAQAKATDAGTAASGTNNADSGSGRLPFELAKVARQFPVTLYTGKDCAPCNSGRNLLVNRGIPFAEKTVENYESAEALKQLSGHSSLPLMTIGSQQLKGFSETSWTQYLNAAGYPQKSALPSNYKRPSPVALAVAKEEEPDAPAKNKSDGKASEPASPQTPVAPSSGIRF